MIRRQGAVSFFKDGNPDAPPEARYKAFLREGKAGLYPYGSPDGIHWSALSDEMVITDPEIPNWKFDSQNLAFWDPVRGEYRAYWRAAKEAVRDIRTAASPDFIHWEKMQEAPVYDRRHRGLGDVPEKQVLTWLDSQNLAFWSRAEGRYVLYYRVYTYDGAPQTADWTQPSDNYKKRVRTFEKAVSDDFLNWERVGVVDCGEDYPNVDEQFYTNGVMEYPRAPHIRIALPMRYCDHGLTASTYELPDPEPRQARIGKDRRWGTACSDTILMSSRDGLRFTTYPEPFIAPGPRTSLNWSYGDAAVGITMCETPSPDAGFPRELSFFAKFSSNAGAPSELWRCALRLDGFVSAHAGRGGGELVTRPLVFDGDRLSLNFATSAAGWLRVELQDEGGQAIEGFALEDSGLVYGDTLDRTLGWNGNRDVSSLKGRPVRLRFAMKEADIYSFVFE